MSDSDDLFGSDQDLDDVLPPMRQTIDVVADDNDDDDRQRRAVIALGAPRTVSSSSPVRIGAGAQSDLSIVKLPAWLSVDRREFNREQILAELADKPDEMARYTIRWRKTVDQETGDEFRETNSRLVEWSDGSVQLLVGSLAMDVVRTPLHSDLHRLYDLGNDDDATEPASTCRAQFSLKMLVHAPKGFVSARSNRVKTEAASAQTTKKMFTLVDPEQEAEARVKEHKAQEARDRRERDRRFVPNMPDGFSADFLEQSDDEEEYDSFRRPLRRSYSDDEDAAARLHDAKRDVDVKGRARIKRRSPQRVELPTNGEAADGIVQTKDEEEVDEEEDLQVHGKLGTKRRRVLEESDSDDE